MTELSEPHRFSADAVCDLWEAELALESPGTSQTSEEARLTTLMQNAPIPIISSPPERTWIWSDLHLADRSVLAAWNRPSRNMRGNEPRTAAGMEPARTRRQHDHLPGRESTIAADFHLFMRKSAA